MDIRTRIGFILRPVRLHHMEVDGKKLLVIIKCGLRGVEWIRRYAVVDEVDERLNPLNREFPRPKEP